ncbi:MAG: cell division protein ZapE [Bacteroidia bacterium]|nr:cell division protein ZapE [Bacteroidia bacterium]
MNNIANLMPEWQAGGGPGIKPARKAIYPELVRTLFLKYCPTGYVIDETNKKLIDTLISYFAGDPAFNHHGLVQNQADISKGLYLYGPYGVGKSLLMEIFHQVGTELYNIRISNGMCFKSTSSLTVNQGYLDRANPTLQFDLATYNEGIIYFDDLGAENEVYGKDLLMQGILQERERLRWRTLVTTNLNPGQFNDKYGERLGARLPDMCNLISVKGPNRRSI